MTVAPAAEPAAAPAPAEGPIMLYDGMCGLCAKSVRWILRHERDQEIRFAPLQGATAAALRAHYPTIPEALETVVYIDGGRAHVRGKAFLHLAKHLRAPWRWAYAMRWIPGFLMYLPYRLVASLRYRIFGTVDSCELPAPEHRARFLP